MTTFEPNDFDDTNDIDDDIDEAEAENDTDNADAEDDVVTISKAELERLKKQNEKLKIKQKKGIQKNQTLKSEVIDTRTIVMEELNKVRQETAFIAQYPDAANSIEDIRKIVAEKGVDYETAYLIKNKDDILSGKLSNNKTAFDGRFKPHKAENTNPFLKEKPA